MSNSNPDKIIQWSKYISVVGNNKHEFEYVPEGELKEKGINFDNDPEERYDFDEEDELNGSNHNPVVITPIAIIPLRPFNNITKVFNLWMGETNFNIGEKRTTIINSVPGVEILDVYTRYRFRIAVGNTFKFQNVRQSIEKALNVVPKKTEPVV